MVLKSAYHAYIQHSPSFLGEIAQVHGSDKTTGPFTNIYKEFLVVRAIRIAHLPEFHRRGRTEVRQMIICLSSANYLLAHSFVSKRIGTKAKYKTLLSFDGGGLRLYMTNQVLVRLEELLQDYIYANREQLLTNKTTVSASRQVEVHLADFFDCIAGVSSGSWTALYYASRGEGTHSRFFDHPEVVKKYPGIYRGSAKGINAFFEEYGGQIYHTVNVFCSTELHPPNNAWSSLLAVYHQVKNFFLKNTARSSKDDSDWHCPVYSEKELEEGLEELYGDMQLSEMYTSVLIYSYEMQYGAPAVFALDNACRPADTSLTFLRSTALSITEADVRDTSPDSTLNKTYHIDTANFAQSTRPDCMRYKSKDSIGIHDGVDFYIKDIARGSSALPVYHAHKEMQPVHEPEKTAYTFIDGSMVLPNPVLPSLNFLLRSSETRKYKTDRRRTNTDIAILSLGAGSVIGQLGDEISARGVDDWILSGRLHNLVINGGAEALQSSIEVLLQELLYLEEHQHLRIQFYASRESAEADAVEALGRIAGWEYHKTLKALGERVAKEKTNELNSFIAKYLIRDVHINILDT